jgi:hypothetical protein
MMCSVESENKDINCASSFEIDLFKYQDFLSVRVMFTMIKKSLFSFTVTSSIDIICKHGSFSG